MRFPAFLILCAFFALSACSVLAPAWNAENADRLARPVFMLPRTVYADGFDLKVYERVHARGGPLTIYIEGTRDSLKTTWDMGIESDDPLPEILMGLKLAARDPAKNVIYLARPCQFHQKVTGYESCPLDYTRGAMFAPAVVGAYQTALNEIKARYHATGFHLVGYRSGGGLAVLIAAARKDVLSLRTVEGLLDTQGYTQVHDLPPMTESLNPVDATTHIQNIPQLHYLAQNGLMIPAVQYHSFAQAFVDNDCLSSKLIHVNEYGSQDWTEFWTDWAKDIPVCDSGKNKGNGAAE